MRHEFKCYWCKRVSAICVEAQMGCFVVGVVPSWKWGHSLDVVCSTAFGWNCMEVYEYCRWELKVSCFSCGIILFIQLINSVTSHYISKKVYFFQYIVTFVSFADASNKLLCLFWIFIQSPQLKFRELLQNRFFCLIHHLVMFLLNIPSVMKSLLQYLLK